MLASMLVQRWGVGERYVQVGVEGKHPDPALYEMRPEDVRKTNEILSH